MIPHTITDDQVISWVKVNRKDPITRKDLDIAERLLNRSQPLAARQFHAARLNRVKDQYPNLLAKAIIQLYLGAFDLEHGNCGGAVDRFHDAATNYYKRKDFHCLGATLWLLGMARHAMGQFREAFARWKESRDLMIDLYHDVTRLHRIEGTAGSTLWYNAIITSMTEDLLLAPHDAFEWTSAAPDAAKNTLFTMPERGLANSATPRPSVYSAHEKHDGSETRMDGPAAQVRKRIDETVEAHNMGRVPDLYRYLESLNDGAPGDEFIEIHGFCATLVDYLPKLKQEAIRHLIQARSASFLTARSRMVVCWMLGLLWMDDPARRADAIRSMESSINCARRLAVSADRENNPALREWYNWHAAAMEQVLGRQI